MIRDQHFGEGRYEQSERVIQQLLGVERELVSVEGLGVEAAADWDHLDTPETYLGYARSEQLPSPNGSGFDGHRAYELPERLRLNHWALAGEWTIGPETSCSNRPAGASRSGSHARDAHLVLSPGAREPIPFRVLLDGEAPGRVTRRRRRRGRQRRASRQPHVPARPPARRVRQRTLQITFLEPDAEAYSFTFG